MRFFLAILWLGGLFPVMARAQSAPVETALALAIDASASISSGFLEQQIAGHVAAFRDPAVQQAITSLGDGVNTGGLAVRVILWSSPDQASIPLPWIILHNAVESNAFAQKLATISLPDRGGNTAIGAALAVAGHLLQTVPFTTNKKIIDLVSNGFSNAGTDPAPIRDQLVANGITINGLVVLDEYDWLESYFAESVIGGHLPFVSHIDNPADYVDALRRKLIQELS